MEARCRFPASRGIATESGARAVPPPLWIGLHPFLVLRRHCSFPAREQGRRKRSPRSRRRRAPEKGSFAPCGREIWWSPSRRRGGGRRCRRGGLFEQRKVFA